MSLSSEQSGGRRWMSHEIALLLIVILEWCLFRGIRPRFGSLDNTFDILRHSVEIGLLALVMTPIILAGGIDLSVGSLLGLSAVVFGKLWRDVGMSPPLAAGVTMVLSTLAGGLNGWMITRLRLPPLIVTLGTFSLFRGLAEALTHGVDTFTNFPSAFLWLGQERFFGIPTQVPIFVLVALALWWAVHQTPFGRECRVIGFAPEGARYAGIRVDRILMLGYSLVGFVVGLAAIIYTSRLGQARADAGVGYELFAITAVVLGGTSIFGGVGSVQGSLLGVAAIAILNNGLVHARQPREVAGMLTGALLLVALAISRVSSGRRRASARKRVATASPVQS